MTMNIYQVEKYDFCQVNIDLQKISNKAINLNDLGFI